MAWVGGEERVEELCPEGVGRGVLSETLEKRSAECEIHCAEIH